MLKKTSIILCLFLVPLAAAVSADNSQAAGGSPFFLFRFERTVPAFADNPESGGTLDMSFTLIDTGDKRLARILRSVLYGGLSAEDYAIECMDSFIQDYHGAMEGEEPGGLGQNWEYGIEHEVHIRTHYAVISTLGYSYTGGAHGDYGIGHLVVDMENQTIWELDDLVSGNNFPRLKSLVEKELRRYSDSMTEEPLPPGAPLSSGVFFVDDFELGDFYPAEDGLHFLWNTYALAAYVVGAIDVCVAWEDLEGLLTRQGTVMAETYRK